MGKGLILVALVPVSILAVVFYFFWMLFNEPPPTFFPLKNSQARYTIIKSTTLFQGWAEGSPSAQFDSPTARYYVEYRGEGVFSDKKGGNFFRITVGKSKVDLSPFINKNVIIKKGKFTSSSQQCIVNDCVDIAGPYVVLNIDSIQEAK